MIAPILFGIDDLKRTDGIENTVIHTMFISK